MAFTLSALHRMALLSLSFDLTDFIDNDINESQNFEHTVKSAKLYIYIKKKDF